jgi:methyl-accepting chemotaxis protein
VSENPELQFADPAPAVWNREATHRPATARKPAGKAQPSARAGVAAQQARAKGFALDLAQGGPDADDVDYKACG